MFTEKKLHLSFWDYATVVLTAIISYACFYMKLYDENMLNAGLITAAVFFAISAFGGLFQVMMVIAGFSLHTLLFEWVFGTYNQNLDKEMMGLILCFSAIVFILVQFLSHLGTFENLNKRLYQFQWFKSTVLVVATGSLSLKFVILQPFDIDLGSTISWGISLFGSVTFAVCLACYRKDYYDGHFQQKSHKWYYYLLPVGCMMSSYLTVLYAGLILGSYIR